VPTKSKSVNLAEAKPSDVMRKTLNVSWDDCCVGGEFTSVVTLVSYDEVDPDSIVQLHFENGVKLEGALYGYTVEVL
jgi:hypothetical protein